MKLARSNMVTAAVAAAAALVATGITYASAATVPAPEAAPTAAAGAPRDGGSSSSSSNKGNNEEGKGNEGGGNEGGGGGGHRREGRIEINERSYSSHPGDCITVVSGLGAKTLNIRNESNKTVEVFRGAVCDNGAPIATVGAHSDSFGVHPCPTDGIDVEDGVVASFRVVRHHGGDEGGGGDED
ncbi:hypothetical protein AQI95_15945 [Streptomyces yokosukanensis]|uniref:Uncharacterized protein n=1 Tax=Streptomyces yokosukanensis TaxID=67386 RepID=A0A124HFZ6_9ACTN|nr:hypothetical protein [Streptomyces yokosukanensis]KUN05424.1 hypothetical protein AQI95_15945 [Streptomyces yokosukanensis]